MNNNKNISINIFTHLYIEYFLYFFYRKGFRLCINSSYIMKQKI